MKKHIKQKKGTNMITNTYYLHAPIDSNIFTTIHNLLKHTQQDKILSLTFFWNMY